MDEAYFGTQLFLKGLCTFYVAYILIFYTRILSGKVVLWCYFMSGKNPQHKGGNFKIIYPVPPYNPGLECSIFFFTKNIN